MTVFNKANPRRLSLQHLQQIVSVFGVRGTTQIWGRILICIEFSSPHSDGVGQKSRVASLLPPPLDEGNVSGLLCPD